MTSSEIAIGLIPSNEGLLHNQLVSYQKPTDCLCRLTVLSSILPLPSQAGFRPFILLTFYF